MTKSAALLNGLEADGWRPSDEAPCPSPPVFVRLAESQYGTGERTEEGNWIALPPELIPIYPTHFKPFPD